MSDEIVSGIISGLLGLIGGVIGAFLTVFLAPTLKAFVHWRRVIQLHKTIRAYQREPHNENDHALATAQCDLHEILHPGHETMITPEAPVYAMCRVGCELSNDVK